MENKKLYLVSTLQGLDFYVLADNILQAEILINKLGEEDPKFVGRADQIRVLSEEIIIVNSVKYHDEKEFPHGMAGSLLITE